MLGGHWGFHFSQFWSSSKLLPAFPQGVAITSLCFAARGNRVLLSYTAPDLRLSGSVPRKRGATLYSGVLGVSVHVRLHLDRGRVLFRARPRDGAASISADSSIQLGEGSRFRPINLSVASPSPCPLHQLPTSTQTTLYLAPGLFWSATSGVYCMHAAILARRDEGINCSTEYDSRVHASALSALQAAAISFSHGCPFSELLCGEENHMDISNYAKGRVERAAAAAEAD